MKLLVAAAVSATLAFGACGGDSDTVAEPAAGNGPAAVTIMNFQFTPSTVEVRVGDEVTVTNNDTAVQAAHTLTADDRSFDTGNLAPDATATLTLEKAGTFTYRCELHSYMKGTIQVQG